MIVESSTTNSIEIANAFGRECGVIQFGRILSDTSGVVSLDSLECLFRVSVQNGFGVGVGIVKAPIGGFGFVPATTRFFDAGGGVGRERGEQRFGSIVQTLIATLNVLKFVFDNSRLNTFTLRFNCSKLKLGAQIPCQSRNQ